MLWYQATLKDNELAQATQPTLSANWWSSYKAVSVLKYSEMVKQMIPKPANILADLNNFLLSNKEQESDQI